MAAFKASTRDMEAIARMEMYSHRNMISMVPGLNTHQIILSVKKYYELRRTIDPLDNISMEK
jgi:peroxiredoxin